MKYWRYIWLGTMMAIAAAAMAQGTVPPSTEQKVELNIAAQPIGDALNEFARQAGMEVVLYSQLGRGVVSAKIEGWLAPAMALERMLANTGLRYEYLGARTVGIRMPKTNASETGKPTADASAPDALASRLAQTDAASSPSSPGTAEDARRAGEGKISEIIVTAQRRSERLQDVPLSIAVVTAEDIDRRHLVGAEDYLRGIPGVNQVQGAAGQSIVIRGIETDSVFQGFRAGVTTATYFGETPTTSSAGLIASTTDIKLVDIERVEVLRGPQGTAFGSSSLGGAVRTIPVAPKLNGFEGKVAVGYSDTSDAGGDNYNVQAVGNLPLVDDKLAIRAVAYAFSDSGFYRNRAGSNAAFQAAWAIPFGAQAFATDADDVGAYYVTGGRIAALFQASNDLRFTLSYLKQKTETDGWALATTGGYEQALPQVAPEHVRRGQTGGLLDTDLDIVNAVMEYGLGWADLFASYSYLNGGTTFAQAYPAIALNWAVSAGRQSDFRGHVGEIRLATKLEGPLNFLAGLYYESNDDEYANNVLWYGDPATNFFAPGQRLGLDYLDRRDLEQKAAFGEVSWRFLSRFTLTGGVRAYDYKRTFRLDQHGFFAPGGNPPPTREDTKASDTNFRANLSYKLGDNGLLYAGWAQGFRFGRPQVPLTGTLCDLNGDGVIDGTGITLASTGKIDSDSLDSYEIGGKFALLDRRLTLDAAVFRMDWSEIPVTVRPPGATGCPLTTYTANLGNARSEGVEVQANIQVTHAFHVYVGGSWIDARLTEAVPAQGFRSGNKLPGSPEKNANLGLQYDFKIGGYNTSVRADSIYVGPFWGDVPQSAVTQSGDYVKLDTSARMEVGNLNIDLFVRNLTNEDAFTFRGPYSFVGPFYGYQMRPRTIGFQLGYAF